MANVFNFCAKISLPKETEKFKPVEKKSFSSGWENMTIKFNAISGTNRVLCLVQGGKWGNEAKNSVKTFSKSTTDANGKVTKGVSIEIPWAKRFDKEQIEKVAGFKKFICDTGDYKERYKLQDLVKAFENGSVTDEQMAALDIHTLEDAKAALEKSQAKRREFISEWDFAEFVTKLVASDKYKNSLFNISGNYEVAYNAEKDRFYTNYHVNRITLATDDAEPTTEMKVDFYYGEDAWDDSGVEETGKVVVNGFLSYYDSNLKKNGFQNVAIVIREANEKKRNALKRKFAVEEGVKQIGLTLSVIEGAEKVEITIDMLSEEEQEDISLGLLDFEEVKRSMNNNIVGDRISELRFAELTPKKNIPQDTIYTMGDMCPAKMEVVEEEDEVVDIFSNDFDDEL